ncbi:uncharacterized protein LOC125778139 [Bactrocera dorsalis]|uniref:Uncharacterized protein LOC125778139 n=1 Tax=Bactrocera dorsalis TaxID=27457 RepID=A0ABM3JN40_BACDO|nr:uncharacterized protein LOC125778139 [Bactrocera dorsalis]
MDNVADHTVAQLRAWLRRLELPSSGNKSSLVLRLQEVPASERGECPSGAEVEEILLPIFEDQQTVPGTDDVAAAQVEDGSTIQQVEEQPVKIVADAGPTEVELLKRETNLLRREKNLLERENAMLQRMMLGGETLSHPQSNQATISLDLIKNLIPEYEGGVNFNLWAAQFKSVTSAYTINEGESRIIFLNKLKGKAQQWLYGNPDFATQQVDELISQMNQVFGSGENKVVLRRKFETRKWKSGERFIEYFNDKVVLANQLQLGEEELVEYIIDGIPDYRLRNQAYMQCYTTKAQLLQAFSKIETGPKPIAPAQSQIQERRCYNCSSRGHLAAECRKPKREMGTCYGCGSQNHQIATCPEKKTVHAVNEYNV